MSQLQAEVLLLTLNALGAGILMFITGVVQKLMDQMDELEFKRFMNRLDVAAMSDPFAVTVASVPIVAAVVYLVAFGFNHWWFIAGFIVWAVGSSMTKVINMPVYEWLADAQNTDREALRDKRRALRFGNRVRAWTTLASVLLMACQFGPLEVVAASVVCVVFAVPLLWLASKYTPGARRTVSA